MRFRLPTLLTLVFFFAIGSYGQTAPCGERDFKCQLDALTKALKDNPRDAENYYNLGLFFQRMGAHKEAIESFSMYVAIPGLKSDFAADGYNNRGISHRASKRPDLAIADYDKAIGLNAAKRSQFLVNRANALIDLGKNDAALADYGAAASADPKSAQPYAQRALLLMNLTRKDDAMKDFAKSIELDPSYPEPYYNRGVIYGEHGEFGKAVSDYDKYIALVKTPEYLLDGYLNRGLAHASLGNLEKAVADLTKVIDLDPNFVNGYRARAMVYRNMKKSDLADADERKAAQLAGKPKT